MDEMVIKRVMPHSNEAEQSVIGSMIMDREAIVAVSEMLTEEDFYQHHFGIYFSSMVELFNEGKPVDLVTLQSRLSEKDLPEEMSSLAFINDIVQNVPTSSNARYYAEIVSNKSILRKMIRVTEGIANQCYMDKDKLDDILEQTEKQVFDLLQRRSTRDYVSIKDLVIRSLENIEAASKNKGSVTGVSTGYYELDYYTAGFQKSDLILLAARPSVGKTAFALNIAEHAILRTKTPTVFFSLEMDATQLVKRLLSMDSRIPSQSIRTGSLKDEEWGNLVESGRKLGNAPLIIDDTPGISISEMRSKCRKYKLEHNIGLIMIDYLQLMQGSRKIESRQQEISEISRSLKALAREVNCPLVALSQLSREVEKREDKRPMLSDLRESGAIEQDADLVMFIYRDEYYKKDTPDKGVAEIIIGKQRNGPTGTVKLGYQPEFTRFVNLERREG